MSISFRSHFWRAALRKVFKNQKLSISEHRASGKKTARLLSGTPKTVRAEKIDIEGIHAEWLTPLDVSHKQVILYLHGGGYVTGSIETYRMMCGLLAQYTGVQVLLPDYRLAPENPFPAALYDSLMVYRWLLEQGHSSTSIIIAGDSAGGGLSLVTVLALRDQNESLPAAVVCLSPWTDLTLKNETHITKAESEAVLRTDVLREWAIAYTNESNFSNPLVSPVYADFQGFPPLLIQVGTDEILLGDSILLAEKAKADGVQVELKIWEGMWHDWHILGGLIPESKKAFEEIGQFVRARFNGNVRI
jgi:monoterpene epsilon-lactone hydrolase